MKIIRNISDTDYMDLKKETFHVQFLEKYPILRKLLQIILITTIVALLGIWSNDISVDKQNIVLPIYIPAGVSFFFLLGKDRINLIGIALGTFLEAYINLREFSDDPIEEAFIEDIIPYNYEIKEIEINGEISEKIPVKHFTPEGLKLGHKVKNLENTEDLTVRYHLRPRVSRTIILPQLNNVKIIKTHSNLKDQGIQQGTRGPIDTESRKGSERKPLGRQP